MKKNPEEPKKLALFLWKNQWFVILTNQVSLLLCKMSGNPKAEPILYEPPEKDDFDPMWLFPIGLSGKVSQKTALKWARRMRFRV